MSEVNELRNLAESLVNKTQIGEMLGSTYPTVVNFLKKYDIKPIITLGRADLYDPEDIKTNLRAEYAHILTVLGYITPED